MCVSMVDGSCEQEAHKCRDSPQKRVHHNFVNLPIFMSSVVINSVYFFFLEKFKVLHFLYISHYFYIWKIRMLNDDSNV